MHSNKCNLTLLPHLYTIPNEQKSEEMHPLFSSQTKCALQKAAIIHFGMLTTMLLVWHVVGFFVLHTSVPISHVETLLLFFFFYIYDRNSDILNQLKEFS